MIDWQLILPRIEAFAREHLPQDMLHGRQHIERVLFYAHRVNRELQGNREIIQAACLLHDTGHSAGKETHHLHSKTLALQLLQELGVEEEAANLIGACIETHSRQYSTDKPASREAKVLYDADGMDLFGAIGLMRALLSAGNRDFQAVLNKLAWRLEQVDNFYSQYARAFVKEQSAIIQTYYGLLKTQLVSFV